ncbi:MAG: hypothetical protein MI919_06075, partial [Holophagales bacterium]|nr:hypothetical protein [Holophagales bacterium]
MSGQRWERVFEVFERAIELTTEARAGYLVRACGRDPELRRGVDELLAAHEEGTSFLDRPVLDRHAPEHGSLDGPAAGRREPGRADDQPVIASAPLAELPMPPRREPRPAPGEGALEPTAAGLPRPARTLRFPDGEPLTASRGFGPYRLVRQIGQGGTSTVYLAVREDEAFHRRVVIKVVRHDMRSPHLLGRLRTERRILASLEHPNIARLYDGGSTDDGNPYF